MPLGRLVARRLRRDARDVALLAGCLTIAACRFLEEAPAAADARAPAPGPAQASSASGSSPHATPTTVSSAGAAPAVRTIAVPMSFAPIAKHADPSVVTIRTTGAELAPSPFFGGAVRRETKGLGTGFVVDKDGVILTNNHVIKDAEVITVRLSNDREYPAKIVGRDVRTDIGVVKIDVHDLAPLALGDSDAIDVGDWVVAIGNPFGLSHTVSAGIISGQGAQQGGRAARPDRLL